MNKYIAAGLAGVFLFAAGYGSGRYLKPARVEVKTETKTEQLVSYRDRIVYRKAAEATTHARTETVVKPDGTKTTVTTVDRDYHSTTDRIAKTAETIETTTKATASQVIQAKEPRAFMFAIGPEYRLRELSLTKPDISASLAWRPTPLPVILDTTGTLRELSLKDWSVTAGIKFIFDF